MTCSLYTTWCNFFFKMERRRLHLLSIWRKKDRKHVTVNTSIGLWIFQVLLWRMSKAMWNMCFWHASNMRGSLAGRNLFNNSIYKPNTFVDYQNPKHSESGLSFWNENSGSMVHKSGPSLVVGASPFRRPPTLQACSLDEASTLFGAPSSGERISLFWAKSPRKSQQDTWPLALEFWCLKSKQN